jgi:hypothetical protein
MGSGRALAPVHLLVVPSLCPENMVRAWGLCLCLMYNVYYCETVSEQRATRCIVAPGDPDQRRWEAHPGTPPPVPRVEKHETPERD